MRNKTVYIYREKAIRYCIEEANETNNGIIEM